MQEKKYVKMQTVVSKLQNKSLNDRLLFVHNHVTYFDIYLIFIAQMIPVYFIL